MTSRYRLDQLLPRSVVVAERHQRTVDAPPERGLAGQVWKPTGDEAARVGNGFEFTARPGGTLVETGTRVFAMVDRAPRSIRARSVAWPRATMWAGYLSAAWALMFAGPHVVWGVGGSAGLDTALNREVIEHRSGWFLALKWGIGLCCVAGAAVALATVRPRGYPVPLPAFCAAWPGWCPCCWPLAPWTSTSSSAAT